MLRSNVEKVLEEKVRPMLLMDGGDLEIISLDEKAGELTIRLLGKCSGCPSAQMTMETIVENEVMTAVPEIKKITLDTGVSLEIVDFALKILRHEVAS